MWAQPCRERNPGDAYFTDRFKLCG